VEGACRPDAGHAARALLLVGAAIVGHQRAAADETQRHRYQEIVRAQWLDQPDRHPHRVAHYGFLVFRPRAPLSFFDTGVENYTGTSLFLEAHRRTPRTSSTRRKPTARAGSAS
jgi:ABC-2 type transport system permease protein